MDLTGEAPRLKPKDGADDSNMPDFFADLGLKAPITSLDEDNVEQDLVPAARRRIAMDRQQLLATMVMMGVNRLVVTNGTIEASCFFELDTTDLRKRHDTATSFAERTSQRQAESGYGGDTKRHGEWSGKWEGQGNQYTKSSSGDWKGSYDRNTNWFSKTTSNDTATFRMATASTRRQRRDDQDARRAGRQGEGQLQERLLPDGEDDRRPAGEPDPRQDRGRHRAGGCGAAARAARPRASGLAGDAGRARCGRPAATPAPAPAR